MLFKDSGLVLTSLHFEIAKERANNYYEGKNFTGVALRVRF